MGKVDIIFLILLSCISLYLIIFRKFSLNLWYKTYHIEQYDKEEKRKMKKTINLTQTVATIISILGTIFVIFSLLKN